MTLLLLLACDGPSGETGAPPCAGPGVICTFAGTGTAGLGDEAVAAVDSHLYLPQDLTFGPDGLAYLIDWNAHRIRQVDESGVVRTVAGTGMLGDGPEGPALEAAFNHPTNIAFDPLGRMVIAAWHNSRIERVDLTTWELEFICGDGTRDYAGDGEPAEQAKLDLPSSVAFDAAGNLYISDMANQRIRRIDGDGIIDTYAGTGEAGFSGDGGPAADAQFHATKGQAAAPANRIAISPDQKLYVADTGNHRVRVIDLATSVIDTLAGNGTPDASGDGGPATGASLFGPTDVAVGPDGEVYVADTENSCVRVVYPDGTIDTFAGRCGTSGYEGDGGDPRDALLNRPYGVALDPDGNVYVGDAYNHVFRVVYR